MNRGADANGAAETTAGRTAAGGKSDGLETQEETDRKIGERIGPEWPPPSYEDELAVGTPAGAAYDLGRLTARLVAHTGLAPLVAGGYFGELRATGREERGVRPTPADHDVPAALRPQYHWMRACLTAALGAGSADGLRVLDELRDSTPAGCDSEEEADESAHAFYPRDAVETALEKRWPDADLDGLRNRDQDFDRDTLSTTRLKELVEARVRPAVAFAEGVRALVRDAQPHLLDPFDLGRALAELEYPPGCWRSVLVPPVGTRWPLDRGDLHRRDGAAVPASEQPEPPWGLPEDLPERAAADIQFRREQYLSNLAAYPADFAAWEKGEGSRREGHTGKRRPAFYPEFPLVPAVGFVTVGPYEVEPDPSTLRQVPRLWRALGLPPEIMEHLPDLVQVRQVPTGYRLNAASHAVLQAFCENSDAAARATLDPTRPPMLTWDHGVKFDPATGVVYRHGIEASLRDSRGNNELVFAALIRGRSRLPAAHIAEKWDDFRFNKFRGWKPGAAPTEDALEKFAERLSRKLDAVRLRIVYGDEALKLIAKPLHG